jgi:serine/threonine protein kinase
LKELLGAGAFGTVYQVCQENDCGLAIKLVILKTDWDVEKFRREAEIAQVASDGGYGPKLYMVCIGDGSRLQSMLSPAHWVANFVKAPVVGIIVQEAWDGSLSRLSPHRWCTADVLAQLEKQVKTMHDDGFVHADLLPKNVLFRRRSDGGLDVTLTDFGNSFRLDHKHPQRASWLQTLYEYMWSPQNSAAQAIGSSWLSKVTLLDIVNNPKLLDEPILQLLRQGCQGTVATTPAKTKAEPSYFASAQNMLWSSASALGRWAGF